MKEQFEKSREHSREVRASISRYSEQGIWINDLLEAYKKEAETFRKMVITGIVRGTLPKDIDSMYFSWEE